MYRIVILTFSVLLLSACGSSNRVCSNRLIQKRKYTKGWHLNFEKKHKPEKPTTNVADKSDKISLQTVKSSTICVDDGCTEVPITYTQDALNIQPETIEIKEAVFDVKEFMVNSIKSQQAKLNTIHSESQESIYPRFGVNDAETTLWIGVICLVVGLVFLILMEFTPFVLSIILLLAGSVLAMIGILNLIIGFFRSIL